MISNYEIRESLRKLRESGADSELCDNLQFDIENLEDAFYSNSEQEYSNGYEDGLSEGSKEPINEIVAFSRTEKQPRGWITHNRDFFGFGDTAEESMVDYLQKATEL